MNDLTCILDTDSVSAGSKKCPCPKPCTQIVYEPSLSQASLSVLSVDNILHEGFNQLLAKYRRSVRQSFSPKKVRICSAHLVLSVREIHRTHRTCLAKLSKCPAKGFDVAGHFVW